MSVGKIVLIKIHPRVTQSHRCVLYLYRTFTLCLPHPLKCVVEFGETWSRHDQLRSHLGLSGDKAQTCMPSPGSFPCSKYTFQWHDTQEILNRVEYNVKQSILIFLYHYCCSFFVYFVLFQAATQKSQVFKLIALSSGLNLHIDLQPCKTQQLSGFIFNHKLAYW